MIKAIRMHAAGGPEVLRWEEVPLPEPCPTEARIHHTAIGLNFIDVYFRSGLYKTAELPVTLGMEGAGVVTAVGSAVTWLAVGDRVAYAGGPLGAYATDRVMPADRLVKLPDAITDQTAAAMMMQGMTAQVLLRRCYHAQAGDTVVVHAAAGGVGSILCQWARHIGVNVIGVVSSEAKAKIALDNGAAHAVVGYAKLASEVKRITAGAMVPVVFDSVGKDTFTASLDCLAPLGLMVSFGNASGPVPPIEIGMLGARGSLFLTRPSIAHYTAKRADLESTAQELFDVVLSGAVKIQVTQTFPLAEAAAAHAALEGRKTTGSVVLLP
jgi:NADPH2:quinone reductase